jgi:hypothetical protein
VEEIADVLVIIADRFMLWVHFCGDKGLFSLGDFK